MERCFVMNGFISVKTKWTYSYCQAICNGSQMIRPKGYKMHSWSTSVADDIPSNIGNVFSLHLLLIRQRRRKRGGGLAPQNWSLNLRLLLAIVWNWQSPSRPGDLNVIASDLLFGFRRHSWRPSLLWMFNTCVLSLETKQALQQYLSKAWFCVILTHTKFTNVCKWLACPDKPHTSILLERVRDTQLARRTSRVLASTRTDALATTQLDSMPFNY